MEARSEPRVEQRAVDIFLQYLRGEGATTVFGIPGGLLHPFFEALESAPDFKLIVARHEEGAAFMADGFARVSRRLGVCAGTSGPGSTNLLTGVSVAFADSVPLLVVTGQAAFPSLGKGAAQETSREDMDIVAMFRPVTKYSTMVTAAEALPHHLRRALRLAHSGRPGPVHLNFPVDLWEKPVEEEAWFDPATYRPSTRAFDRQAVAMAAQKLLEAERPVFLAGSGVAIAGAEEHLASLAEMLPARVATTPRGKGVFREDHALSLGVFGMAGLRQARETILGEEADVLFAIGASLNETATLNWHPALSQKEALIQCDIETDRVGRNYPVDIPLVGDAQTILVEILYHVHRLIREGGRPRSTWPGALPLERGNERYADPSLRTSDARPVTPQRWRCDLEEVLPDDAILFSDIGGHMLFNLHHLCIRGQQRFLINLGFGSMGHGTAGPIGAALATHRPIFAIVGDGCFAMNGMELLTAAEHDLPVVWIVENNNMHGATWHGSQLVGRRRPMESARYRRPIEVAAIARAMGLIAFTVDGPGEIQRPVREALAAGRPAVIEVRVDPAIAPPLGDRARGLAEFIR
jgi:acetolactate synthase I/II/III large subunit